MSRHRGQGRHGGAGSAAAPAGTTPATDGLPVEAAGANGASPRPRQGGPRPAGPRQGSPRPSGRQDDPRRIAPRPSGPRPSAERSSAGSSTPEPATAERARSRRQPRPRPAPAAVAPAEPRAEGGDEALETEEGVEQRRACTLAQMRRFIKSRPYVPVHELRRRFEITGIEDEVNPVATDRGTFYVGLPQPEATYLADLIKAGEVGYELLLDPASPALIGVFPMRPVARQ
jgi:hypothetical protein